MKWSFAKYVGSGNDFILFDNRNQTFPIQPTLIQRLCHRQNGIGADGLLLLGNSSSADFSFRIFNSDGSEAEMCGNGLRCFVQWLIHLGYNFPVFRIEVMQTILTAKPTKNNAVLIEIPSPKNHHWDICLRYENQFLRVHFLNTGVPHTVIFTNDIDNLNLMKIGGYIRHHSLWQPKGTNVTFVEKIDHQRLKTRTYERGVEGETLACGTGAAAASLAAARLEGCPSPISVETRSGEILTVDFILENQTFSQVTLTGTAKCIFQGEIDLPI